MSAINMMMRDTGSVSDTSSNDTDPSHTETSTPSSDLPEHISSDNNTIETQTANANYRNRWMINRANYEGPMSDEDWATLGRCYQCGNTGRPGNLCRGCDETFACMDDEGDWSYSSANLGRTIHTHTETNNNNNDVAVQTNRNDDTRTQRRIRTYFSASNSTATDGSKPSRHEESRTHTTSGAGVGPVDGTYNTSGA
jgi:hypothetical protein